MKKTISDYPELAKEWHSTKNGNLNPSDISDGSDKKIWWHCKKGHEWEISCYRRTKRKSGCPYCVNQKVCADNCLATTHPELVEEWHPTKNGNITPNDIVAGTCKKYWWKCNKDHEWEAVSNNRTGKNKTGCPYCSNKFICADNCLATTHPELAKEWHSTKNNNLTSNDVVAGSNKKVWWVCNKKHEWKASCNGRIQKKTQGRTDCPYCINQKVCIDNCLATTNPELIKEWNITKNDNLTPNDIVAGSNKKVWWICNKKHEWKAIVNGRTKLNKKGCPYCVNQKVCADNCLATTHPELAEEWHSTKNDNLTPNDVVAGSHKKVWWVCNKKHEWEVSPLKRTFQKRGCPYCVNQKVCADNCLATTHPELAKEWHSTKNDNLTPDEVTAGSDKKVWWICSKGHEWEAVCGTRTEKRKNGCPICSESKGEKEITRILKKLNIKYKREYKFDSCKDLRKLPFDFTIWSNNKIKIIEYHGIQHYKPCSFGSLKTNKYENFIGVQNRDKIKKEWCKTQNIPFLEISYEDYEKIEEKIEKFLLQS